MIDKHKVQRVSLFSHPGISLMLGCVLVLCAVHARAFSGEFVTPKGLDVAADTVVFEGVAYTSLTSLVAQLGGESKLLPARFWAEIGTSSVIININDVEVRSSSGRFDLRYPLNQHEQEAYVAVIDVPTLFADAFQITLSPKLPEPVDPTRVTIDELLDPSTELLHDQINGINGTDLDEPHAVRRRVVVIDPGHGGFDKGSSAPEGLVEKEFTLAIALEVKRIAEETLPVNILLTRQEDIGMSSVQRANVANGSEGELMISIHLSAGYSSTIEGAEVFFSGDLEPVEIDALRREHPFKEIAVNRRTRDSHSYAQLFSEAFSSSQGLNVNGIHRMRLNLLRLTDMPSIMVEVGYVSHPGDAALLLSEQYRAEVASGIVDGIGACLARAVDTTYRESLSE